ncbi:Aminopeptidase [uncultured Desulfobacterium sp.]|uniref:Aminopeptidase n=1 Tax=uncultured Desulfobacterium sp. TaxID=201089 RepID=A0A445MX69_9BACT|nr:Aminopeptidase [uncultured Desulfobacterium sp.]
MLDPRITRLADVLINYSCEVREGERILIEAIDVPHEFTCECIRLARAAGAIPIVKLDSHQIRRSLMKNGTYEGWELVADAEKLVMENVQCYIGARGNPNVSELSDVSGELQKIYEKTVWNRVHVGVRIPNTRWVVLRWPGSSMAQMAEMSTEAFEDFYFNVCTMDFKKMSNGMKPLIARMENTDQVHIKGPRDTDLSFSIKGMPVIGCDGKLNIPDGEVFTAPVKLSVNGVIHYNAPTIYHGTTHNDIRLVFKDGKIIEATGSNTAKLNEVLDTDEGARYVGEFAIGLNPHCTKAMKDILFDEKITGSIHFTPGSAYQEADNGNKSDIHWDMVLMQTPEFGGGEIYFDGELIRKDGIFVVDDLIPLNPENLK